MSRKSTKLGNAFVLRALACPQHRYDEAIRRAALLSTQAFFIHLLARDVLNNRLHSQYTFSNNTNIKEHEAKPSFLSSGDKDISLNWLFTKILNPAPCPMPHAPCPMPHAPCPMPIFIDYWCTQFVQGS